MSTTAPWEYGTWEGRELRPFGDETTYRLGLRWLYETCDLVEDWGAGLGYARRFVPQGKRYFAIDQCPSSAPFVDKVGELLDHQSRPEGLFMRHIIEHNANWGELLDHALGSFVKRFCLVIFTPFSAETRCLRSPGDPFLDISFEEGELLAHLAGYHWDGEHLLTGTQYGGEHIFYIEQVTTPNKTRKPYDTRPGLL